MERERFKNEKPKMHLEGHLPHDRAHAKAEWAKRTRGPTIEMDHNAMSVSVKRKNVRLRTLSCHLQLSLARTFAGVFPP